MTDDIVSLEDRARQKASKRSGPDVLGSVNDLCTRKEAIDAAVSVGRTVYDQVSAEHGKAFAELERQVAARIRGEFAARTVRARVARAGVRVLDALRRWARALNTTPAEYNGVWTGDEPPKTPDDVAVALPKIREFEEWGPESDAWVKLGGVALGPDALNPGPLARRLRCPSTDTLREYAAALGADPAAIEDGELSKAVEGEVLDDCRKLVRGEVIKRVDTKPELVV